MPYGLQHCTDAAVGVFVSVVIPTRSRPDALERTLSKLGGLDARGHACEVVVADNASSPPARAPGVLENGWPVRVLRLEHNAGAAARNTAAHAAVGDWLLMLDDDSAPDDAGWFDVAEKAEPDVAAIGADIRLPNGRHEAGGLPEVFVGCGALIRRRAFLDAGGYDESFCFYGEETDLCARLIAGGARIRHERAFRVTHMRAEQGRDIRAILERLTANEAITVWRYAPEGVLDAWLTSTLERRREVARREGALCAYERGLESFRTRSAAENRRPLGPAEWDRLVGRAFARGQIEGLAYARCAVRSVGRSPGKHRGVIVEELSRAGRLVEPDDNPDAIIAGTLAPGVALDWAEELGGERPAVALTPLASVRDKALSASHPK